MGILTRSVGPLVFSDRIQSGETSGYGTVDFYPAAERNSAAGTERPGEDPMRPAPEQMRSTAEPTTAGAESTAEKPLKT